MNTWNGWQNTDSEETAVSLVSHIEQTKPNNKVENICEQMNGRSRFKRS